MLENNRRSFEGDCLFVIVNTFGAPGHAVPVSAVPVSLEDAPAVGGFGLRPRRLFLNMAREGLLRPGPSHPAGDLWEQLDTLGFPSPDF